MAELLIKSKPHWMDSLTKDKIDKMSAQEKQSYDARSQIGDIIVVRPDGWKWGNCECPPDYIVVKLPNVKVEDVKHYEESLMDTTDKEKPIMLKVRKHAIDIATVDNCKLKVKGVKEIPKATFDSKLIVKVK